MWVTKLLISPVKKRIFCPKTTKFSPKLAFLSIACSFCDLLVGWLVVVARAVSRKTPIYFLLFIPQNRNSYHIQKRSNHFLLTVRTSLPGLPSETFIKESAPFCQYNLESRYSMLLFVPFFFSENCSGYFQIKQIRPPFVKICFAACTGLKTCCKRQTFLNPGVNGDFFLMTNLQYPTIVCQCHLTSFTVGYKRVTN